MKTGTTMLLLTLFAISSLGCGHGGGAAEPPAAASTVGARTATDLTATKTVLAQAQPTHVVADGVYEICDTKEMGEPKEGVRPDMPTGLHGLKLWDEISISKGEFVSNVVFRLYKEPEQDPKRRQQMKPDTVPVPMVTCCGGERLGATMGFKHQKKGDKEPKDRVHAIFMENVPTASYGKCTREPIILITFCYPTYDDNGERGWVCRDRKAHGGDVHAQPLSISPSGQGSG